MNFIKLLKSAIPVASPKAVPPFNCWNSFYRLSNNVPCSVSDSSCKWYCTSNVMDKLLWKSDLSLVPINPNTVSTRGMRTKKLLRRICEHCYFIRIDGVLHVNCPIYGAHKQVARQLKKKRYWILSHAAQGKHRPY